jgi:16S rRNA (guanine966-N2)-methyltransferase
MRIIGGEWRGIALAAVGKGDQGKHLRPTTDRVRESLFNVLQGGKLGDPISDARVLDLFAGTGALGLEAVSRGASSVTFVDDGRVAGGLIRDNIRKTCGPKRAKLIKADATRLPQNPDAPYDLIFLDPPYGKSMGPKALTLASQNGWIAPESLIVWEENTPQVAPDGFSQLDQRKYGDTWMTFLEVAGAEI